MKLSALVLMIRMAAYSTEVSLPPDALESAYPPPEALELDGLTLDPQYWLEAVDEALGPRYVNGVPAPRADDALTRLQTALLFERCAQEGFPAEACLSIPLIESRWTPYARRVRGSYMYCGMFQQSARYSYSYAERQEGRATLQGVANRCDELNKSPAMQVHHFMRYLRWMMPDMTLCSYLTGRVGCGSQHPYAQAARSRLTLVADTYRRMQAEREAMTACSAKVNVLP